MPALPSVPNVVKVELGFNLSPDTSAFTRMHYLYGGGPPSSTNLNSWASDLESAFNSHLNAYLANVYALTSIVLTDLNLPTGAVGEWSGDVIGGDDEPTLPLNCCVLINFQIPRRYRGGKPRVYLPLGTTHEVGGPQTWAGSFVTAVSSGWGSFANATIGNTYGDTSVDNLVSVSYYSGFTNYTGSGGRAKVRANVRSSPLVDDITGHIVSGTIGSQRRRLRA